MSEWAFSLQMTMGTEEAQAVPLVCVGLLNAQQGPAMSRLPQGSNADAPAWFYLLHSHHASLTGAYYCIIRRCSKAAGRSARRQTSWNSRQCT